MGVGVLVKGRGARAHRTNDKALFALNVIGREMGLRAPAQATRKINVFYV